MLTGIVEVAAGAALLYFGALILIRGASALARSMGVAPAVVGLTVVAFGTSLPELVVTVTAATSGNIDMALGNVVGSNISNIGLILGAAACIRALKVELTMLKREAPMGLVAMVLLVALSYDGVLTRMDGMILLAGFAAFLYWSVAGERQAPDDVGAGLDDTMMNGSKAKNVGMCLLGLAGVLFGGKFMVDGGVIVASALGVPPVIVGLSIVAVGTSLPELATSLVAVTKGEDDIGVGGVLGSNLFNVLGILGVAATITPIPVGDTFFRFQYPVLIIFTVGLLPIARSGARITRLEGLLLLAAYLGYVGALYLYPGAS